MTRGTRKKGQNWKFINPLDPRSVLVRTWTVSVQFSKMAGPQKVKIENIQQKNKKQYNQIIFCKYKIC